MWSMLESMVALALEDGFITKIYGENLTIFLKTEKE